MVRDSSRHLVDTDPSRADACRHEAGTTAFAPFHKDTTHLGKPSQQRMISFRVADFAAMVAQRRADGIEVEAPTHDPGGAFARLHDPEGHPIELGQPRPEH